MLDLPLARTTRLLIDELDGELMVYDRDADTAHVLQDSVARVWQLCDGTADAQRIADDLELDVSVVREALEQLESCALLSGSPSTGREISRRETLKKVAKTGAAVASAPLIYSLVIAPSAAMATAAGCATVACAGINQGAANNVCQTPAAIAAGCKANSQCGGSGGSASFCVF